MSPGETGLVRPVGAVVLWVVCVVALDRLEVGFWTPGLHTSAFLTILIGWSTTLLWLYWWVRGGRRLTIPMGAAALLCLLLVPGSFRLGIKDALGLTAAFGLGLLLAELFRKPGYVVAVLFVGACWDGMSLFAVSGPVRRMTEEAPQVLSLLSLQYPLFGRAGWIPILGFADWLLLALVFAICVRENLRPERVLAGIAGGMGLLLVLTVALKPNPALPALPFVALGCLYGLWDLLEPDWPGYREGLSAAISLTLTVMLLVGLIG